MEKSEFIPLDESQAESQPESKMSEPTLEISPQIITLAKNKEGAFRGKIVVTNKSTEHMALKFKSTAPEYYAVKPRSFLLEPSKSHSVKFQAKSAFSPVLTRVTVDYGLRKRAQILRRLSRVQT